MAITIEQFDTLTGEVAALKALCINLRDLIEGGLSTNNLHSNAVQTNNIKDNSIIASHIKALAIDSSKIAVGTITSDQIEDGTIAADDIKTGTLTGLQISAGTITAGLLKTGGQAFSHDLVFSSTDANTVAWTAGTLKTADGTSYDIEAGNTGNMAAKSYIYLDKGTSLTVLQVSVDYDAPLGDEKIPLATAEDSTNNAVFHVFGGGGGVFISGGMIAAHTITATQITAGTITATEITVANLAALSATMGSLNSGVITASTIRSTRLSIGGGTDEDIYFEDSGIRFYDASGTGLVFAKTGLESGFILLGASAVAFGALNAPRIEFYDDDKTIINCVGNAFTFYTGGTLKFTSLVSAPTAHEGDTCVQDSGTGDGDEQWMFYINGAWLHATDAGGW